MEFSGRDFLDFLAGIVYDLMHLGDADLVSLSFRLFLLWLLVHFGRMILSSMWYAIRPRKLPKMGRIFPPPPDKEHFAEWGRQVQENHERRQQEQALEAVRKAQEQAEIEAEKARLIEQLKIRDD